MTELLLNSLSLFLIVCKNQFEYTVIARCGLANIPQLGWLLFEDVATNEAIASSKLKVAHTYIMCTAAEETYSPDPINHSVRCIF